MACFNETGDKCFTGQGTLRFRQAAAGDERTPRQAACFDCSICLDAAVDPVVTLCGHLYCWPCIYKWMQAETSSPQSRPQQCPVCKAPVSERALVPIFGRGSLPTDPKGPHQSRLDVPKRPNATRDAVASMMEGQQRPPGVQRPQLQYGGHYTASQWGAGVFSSTATAGGVLQGLAAVAVHPLMSRSNYSMRPYQLDTSGYRSPRERRQEMRVEESLHQIWIFLFCGAVLCLLFF
ncbi:E3 ubiquitin-protein ligase RMA3-like [Iris pallida]|uniref:E3 ubiquitin-protein ligase RMA n=1 Tax=Iris pallida TaxID=29817 RepID=A0AAX6FND4_IRIPA|nr:E3 ubiquitin-protein ligase RMA3-like [Iris pallida]